MWKNCNNEIDQYKRENILKKIIAIQHYLSLYHEIINDIMSQYNICNN